MTMVGLPRAIVGYEVDVDGVWCAVLSCGHRQHLRHSPPLSDRSWVLTEEGRQSRLGLPLGCKLCEMPVLPKGATVYRETRVFERDSTPAALLSNHTTRAGSWGRIVVRQGAVLYTIVSNVEQSWVLRPGVDGIIAPEQEHRVRPDAHARFVVQFLRVDA